MTNILPLLITTFAGFLTIAVTKYYEKLKAIEEQQRNKKIVIYEQFITFLFNSINNKIDNENIKSETKIDDVTKSLVIWGSEELIVLYNDFNISINKFVNPNFREYQDKNVLDNIYAILGKMLYLIRKDLGFSDFKLKEEDLLNTLLLPAFKRTTDIAFIEK